MTELRISITEIMEEKLNCISNNVGLKPADYVRALIAKDIQDQEDKNDR